MDLEKLKADVEKLEAQAGKIGGAAKKTAADFEKDAALRESARQAMKNFTGTLKQVLMDFLHDRKDPVRPGQLYRDAAAKNIVPGGLAVDPLIIKWGGHVTPTSAGDVRDECAKFEAVASKLIPVLKSYQKE